MADALWFWDDPGGELKFSYEEQSELLPNGIVIETSNEYWGGDYFLDHFLAAGINDAFDPHYS